MSNIQKIVPVLVLLTTLMFVGCGAQREYELAPVSGKVTLDGQPLGSAVVNFQPKTSGDKKLGPGSVGRTNENGEYQLVTITDEPGAWVGSHKVKIYSYSPETPTSSDVDTQPSQERVPDRYNYRTRLTFEVPAQGSQQADFELQTAE